MAKDEYGQLIRPRGVVLDNTDMNRLIVVLHCLAALSGNQAIVKKLDEFWEDVRKKNA